MYATCLLKQEIHYRTKVLRRMLAREWWLSLQDIYPRRATVLLWVHKHVTLFPLSKENINRDC